MKSAVCWLSLLALSFLPAMAQVRVEVSLEQDQFLPGESIVATARVINRSGQTLHLGADDDWLRFTIETGEGVLVPQIDDVPVKGAFTLESSSRASKRVEISPHFALTQPGQYKITATVKIKDWNQESSSQPLVFNIMEGTHLWEQDFGVPRKDKASDSPPEIRRYILQQANYLKTRLRLYMRVTDPAGVKVFKAVPVGTMLSFSHPEPQVDQNSNLHLLYQSWAHAFTYCEYNPDGDLIKRESFDYTGDRPHLRRDGNGNVTVSGGVRRIDPGEFNASEKPGLSSTNQASANK
jgi:hypothetical protein